MKAIIINLIRMEALQSSLSPFTCDIRIKLFFSAHSLPFIPLRQAVIAHSYSCIFSEFCNDISLSTSWSCYKKQKEGKHWHSFWSNCMFVSLITNRRKIVLFSMVWIFFTSQICQCFQLTFACYLHKLLIIRGWKPMSNIWHMDG